MSVFTKAAAKTARWSVVPAIAAGALALAAGPALADGTSVGITTYSGTVYAGQLTVGGAYQCATTSPYDILAVTVVQPGPNGPVTSTGFQEVACTGSTLTWQATLNPSRPGEWFANEDTRVEVTLWTPGDWDGQSSASVVLWA